MGTVEDAITFLKYATSDIISEAALGIKSRYIENADEKTDDEIIILAQSLRHRWEHSMRFLLRR